MTTLSADMAGDRLGMALQAGALGRVSPAAGCLMPLLAALEWPGTPRRIAGAVPHFADGLDIAGLRKVLAELGFATIEDRGRPSDIDPRLLPCLFVPEGKQAWPLVLVAATAQGFRAIDGANGRTVTIPARQPGTIYLVAPARNAAARPGQNWSSWMIGRFRKYALQIFLMTGLTSLLALGIPIFIMVLYDRVIPAKSHETLAFLGAGMAIVLATEAGLRLLRARLIAYIGGRTDFVLGMSVLQQIFRLRIGLTTRAPVGAMVARLQQFEVLREFFVSPMAGVFFELPFVFLSMAAIATIGGPLVVIPVCLAIVFALMAVVTFPLMREANRVNGVAGSERQNFLTETVTGLAAIRRSGAGAAWRKRHRDISSAAAHAQYRLAWLGAVLQTLSHQLMLLAGIATLGFGAWRVMDGAMSLGALIATMAITWRVVGPLQTGLQGLARMEQVIGALRQINRLMSVPGETDDDDYRSFRQITGRITLNHVSFRYQPDSNPALVNVSFDLPAGQVIAVTGPSGCGKSTILRLLLGLYQPQGGSILLDGIDIRQLGVGELRELISFLPQANGIFHGTVAQNLRLAHPLATQEEMRAAVERANLTADLEALPDGYETRLNEAARTRLSEGFLRKLCLAQTYIKPARIWLLDEPGTSLDHADDAALKRQIDMLRGQATVVMVTHRPSHMRMADLLLELRDGAMAWLGPPEQAPAMRPFRPGSTSGSLASNDPGRRQPDRETPPDLRQNTVGPDRPQAGATA